MWNGKYFSINWSFKFWYFFILFYISNKIHYKGFSIVYFRRMDRDNDRFINYNFLFYLDILFYYGFYRSFCNCKFNFGCGRYLISLILKFRICIKRLRDIILGFIIMFRVKYINEAKLFFIIIISLIIEKFWLIYKHGR